MYYKFTKYTVISNRYDQAGNEEEPVFPYKIALKPTGEVNFKETASSLEDFSKQWADIPKGAAPYTFVAYANPNDQTGQELGRVVVEEGCTASKFGDEKLFFQHQRIEEDMLLRPEWKSAYLEVC